MSRDLQESSLALHRLNAMLEEQTKHLADAVHHEAGQLLSTVLIRLDQVALDLPPYCGSCFHEIRSMLEQVGEQLRELSQEMFPRILGDKGLLPAMVCLIERTSDRTGIDIKLDSSIERPLPMQIEMVLYRVVQEALTNIARHARATQVEVRLWENDQVHCLVKDDGTGFDTQEVLKRSGERGLGLVGIQERAESVGGSLRISSLPGQGTEVLVSVPREVRA